MSVFFDIADDLCLGVSWVCVCSVFYTAFDAYGAD